MNKLKQIVLATHSFSQSTNGYLPSINGFTSRSYYLSLYIALLPYVEQGALFKQYTSHFGEGTFGDEYVIPLYLSPADPTLDARPTGLTSYAANAMVFKPYSREVATYLDGASNTIAYAEHYSYNCGGSEFSWFQNESVLRKRPGVPAGRLKVRRATFADQEMGDLYPSPQVAVPILTFQVKPNPSDCNPQVAQTPHAGVMLAALGDGSVRGLGQSMSAVTYWAAVTPTGGEVLGADW